MFILYRFFYIIINNNYYKQTELWCTGGFPDSLIHKTEKRNSTIRKKK